MRIAILDPSAGISGDMTLGALLDAGLSEDWLHGLPGRLGIEHVRVRIERVERAAVVATNVSFDVPAARHDAHGHHVGELIQIVRRAQVSEWVKEHAVRAFQLVGEAEGKVHGVPPEKVHLHEVGAVDALLDIVGAIEGFEMLGVEHVYHLPPVALGDGWVEAAHGRLPVPAPATLHLLEGLEVSRGGPVTGEATTPTGAVLLRVLSEGPPPNQWRQISSHWGAGDRNPKAYPNALRLLLAESAEEAGRVEVIASDIDDLSPEYLDPLREALFTAGALDVQIWPTQGKKGRVSFRLETLAPPDAVDRVIAALFRHSTTAGVRRWPVTRATLLRHELHVELERAVRVRIKVWESEFGTRLKAEYDDVVTAAHRLGRPAHEVAREAEQRARTTMAASGQIFNRQ